MRAGLAKIFHRTLIGVGSNVGNRADTCCAAVEEIRNHPDTEERKISPFYETVPVGVTDQAPFINLVIEMRTALSPPDLLGTLKSMEKKLGRIQRYRWGPREIDLDILLYEGVVISTDNLVIPHPEMHKRAFVLVPACDIAGDWLHPVLNQTLRDLLNALSREGVTRYQGPVPCV